MPPIDPRDYPLIDQDNEYSVTLLGAEWLRICSTLTAARFQLLQRGLEDEASRTMDLPVKIIQQIDPGGWKATDPAS